MKKNLKFIDLFAGVGGFHQAAKKYGECVFAGEIDKFAIEAYKENYGLDAYCDISKVDPKDIPKHDLICAGFPCQAFSKAGKRKGFHETRGTLFFDVERIIQHHKPKYILLENVRNLVSHDNGNTWKVIHENLEKAGYIVPDKPLIISPHQIGVPQLRERVFIPGIRKDIYKGQTYDFDFLKKGDTNPRDILQKGKVSDKFDISEYEDDLLQTWDEFYAGIDLNVLGFPVWVDQLNTNPIQKDLPEWKKSIMSRNKVLYKRNKKFIDSWLKKHSSMSRFIPTHRKFEWQAGDSIKSIYKGIIQFRPSGVRVKKPTEWPALVAMVQIPIIGWKKRRLTPRETANLQSFPKSFKLHRTDQQAYKQMGNSINVKVAESILDKMIK